MYFLDNNAVVMDVFQRHVNSIYNEGFKNPNILSDIQLIKSQALQSDGPGTQSWPQLFAAVPFGDISTQPTGLL